MQFTSVTGLAVQGSCYTFLVIYGTSKGLKFITNFTNVPRFRPFPLCFVPLVSCV